MTTKQWYRALLEDQVLMSPAAANSPAGILPCRVELLNTNTDWACTWSLARTRGIGSDLTGFLFRLIHQLLPTKDRTSRMAVDDPSDIPGRCPVCRAATEDQLHAFFDCPNNSVCGLALLGYVQTTVSNLSPEEALRLELGGGHDEVEQLATVCLLSTGLQYIWEARTEKKLVSLFRMRSEIEARITILRRTRHAAAGDKMMEMMN